MIEHESDLWPERRWAVATTLWVSEAKPFASSHARDAWIKANPGARRAVGKRHPAVKALRQQWRAKALSELRAWKERSR